jgi:hypothetical protein
MLKDKRSDLTKTMLLGLVVLGGAAGLTGCQVSTGGQTLPSPYYLYDDIQYFPVGPKNKLARETADLKAKRAAQEAQIGR